MGSLTIKSDSDNTLTDKNKELFSIPDLGVDVGKGLGEPSIRYCLSKIKSGLLKSLSSKTLKPFFYSTLASVANIYNFHISTRNKVFCPCCNTEQKAFIALSHTFDIVFNSRCPNCNCGSRHRGLIKVYDETLSKLPDGSILIFAPESVLVNQIRVKFPRINISTADLFVENVDYPHQDIQNLSIPAKFDAVLCNHVLEHVPDDVSAISECRRILKDNGVFIVTIPGNYAKNKTIIFDEPDGNGHYRHYALDVVAKFKAQFNEVRLIDMNKISPKKWRVKPRDIAFVCRINP